MNIREINLNEIESESESEYGSDEETHKETLIRKSEETKKYPNNPFSRIVAGNLRYIAEHGTNERIEEMSKMYRTLEKPVKEDNKDDQINCINCEEDKTFWKKNKGVLMFCGNCLWKGKDCLSCNTNIGYTKVFCEWCEKSNSFIRSKERKEGEKGVYCFECNKYISKEYYKREHQHTLKHTRNFAKTYLEFL